LAVTHQLESQGQASSVGLKISAARQPLTSWRARTGIVSRLETQRGTAATHRLERRGQASSAGLKKQRGTGATHLLESRRQVSSAGLKRRDVPQPLTPWRAKDKCHQQASNAARPSSHSPSGEPRTGVISKLQTWRGTAATHQLESRGQVSSAGFKRNKAPQPPTNWRAEDRCRQQAWNGARQAATYLLVTREQASSAGLKRSEARQPLTT